MNFWSVIIALALCVWLGFEIYGLIKSIKQRRKSKNNQKSKDKADNNEKEEIESE